MKWNKETGPGNWLDYHFVYAANFTYFIDLVDENPLFQARTLNKYTYTLAAVVQDQGRETLVLAFTAIKPNHRTTGDYYDRGFAGTLYVNRADYAVTRCEVEWQRDTLLLNGFARKYFARGGPGARNWRKLHSDYRIRQTVTYRPQPGGRYFLDRSVQTWVENYRDLATGRRIESLSVQSLQLANIRAAGVELLPERPPLAAVMLKDKPYQEAFWRTHPQPDGGAAAPQGKASAP